jgi:hypothetical protein
MHVRRSRRVGVWRIRGFEDEIHRKFGNAIRDIPTGDLCGPQQELVENMWHSIGDQEKASPESFDIRIRDPVKFDIPIEVTGGGKVNSRVCVGVSAHRVSGVGKSKCSVSRVVKPR